MERSGISRKSVQIMDDDDSEDEIFVGRLQKKELLKIRAAAKKESTVCKHPIVLQTSSETKHSGPDELINNTGLLTEASVMCGRQNSLPAGIVDMATKKADENTTTDVDGMLCDQVIVSADKSESADQITAVISEKLTVNEQPPDSSHIKAVESNCDDASRDPEHIFPLEVSAIVRDIIEFEKCETSYCKTASCNSSASETCVLDTSTSSGVSGATYHLKEDSSSGEDYLDNTFEMMEKLMNGTEIKPDCVREVEAPGACAPEVEAPGARAPEVEGPGARAPEVEAPGARAPEVVESPDAREVEMGCAGTQELDSNCVCTRDVELDCTQTLLAKPDCVNEVKVTCADDTDNVMSGLKSIKFVQHESNVERSSPGRSSRNIFYSARYSRTPKNKILPSFSGSLQKARLNSVKSCVKDYLNTTQPTLFTSVRNKHCYGVPTKTLFAGVDPRKLAQEWDKEIILPPVSYTSSSAVKLDLSKSTSANYVAEKCNKKVAPQSSPTVIKHTGRTVLPNWNQTGEAEGEVSVLLASEAVRSNTLKSTRKKE